MSENTTEVRRKKVKAVGGAGTVAGATDVPVASAVTGVSGSVSKADKKAKKSAGKVAAKDSSNKTVSKKTDISKPVSLGRTGQYVGMCLLMLAFLIIIPIISQTGQEFLKENFLMTLAIVVAVILTTVGYANIAAVVCAVSIVMFAAFKLYYKVVLHSDFYFISYLWIFIPMMAMVGINMFMSGYSSTQLENALLKKQVSELVMIDPITGLYNLRSMFMDIQRQISYAERNDKAVSLMIVRLRYPVEMKKVLKENEYNKVLKQMALLLMDTVRLEDRIYSIDDKGGFGVLLTCDKNGTEIVEKRMRGKLGDPKWFEGVSTRHKVRTEVRIGYLQYDKDRFNRNAEAFKNAVEEEASYDN